MTESPLTSFFSTFGIIFIAELPDKTALAALVLATQYPTRDVIAGAWLAFLVQTVVAVAAGKVIGLLPARPVHIACAIGFLVFAYLAWKRPPEDESGELADQAKEQQTKRGMRPWVTCFLVVFAAEWGDLTQLATASLVSQSPNTLAVACGATAALWAVTVVAAVTGSKLNQYLSPITLNRISALLFAVIGIALLGAELR